MIPVIYRSYPYSWYWLFCYLLFQLSCCYFLHCYYARTPFPYTHTLIRSLLTILNCTSRYWIFYTLVQVFVELIRFARSWSFSFLILAFLLLLFLFLNLSWFTYIRFSLYFSSLFMWYLVWIFMCHIAVILIIVVYFYSLVRLL